jgi:UDP-N-acetylmuramyl pentapeptide phosphotransferase/UDP-N-acetylglucosamine-1-phosphate transferase
VFFVLVVVNAFNFIDGIDGLAAAIGIISSSLFGMFFLSMNDMLLALLSFSLCGALIAFLIFNFSPARIFMGDTGILSLLAIQLTEETRTSPASLEWLNYQSAPVLVLVLLIVPVVDFIRVTFVRIIKGRSPIRADQNHIHHILVRAGLSHTQTTGLLISINLLFILSAFILKNVNQSILFFAFLSAGILLSQIPYLVLKSKSVSRER